MKFVSLLPRLLEVIIVHKIISDRDLALFNKKYKALLKSNVILIDKVVAYLIKKKGKFIRPALAINVAKSLNSLTDKNFVIASLIEMIHLATLIHDDIVDQSDFRRSWPTVGRIWKNKVAILVGDYIFSRSLSATVQLNDIESIKILSHTSDRLSKGEIFQIQESRKGILNKKDYFSMIKDKTASLFSAACELSARASSSNIEDFKNFKNFGENFGIAYQIKDDINDILKNKYTLGKPVMLDVKSNSLTLPYIYCLENLSDTSKRDFLMKVKTLSKKNKRKEVLALINQYNAIEYCESVIDDFLNKGMKFIDKYPNKNNFTQIINTIFYESQK